MPYDELVQDLAERLWAKTEVQGECLIWIGPASGQMKYGVIGWLGGQTYIHRLIYQFHNPKEKLKIIRHTCDNPRCWNIDHLRNGSTQDNADDAKSKGRLSHGERHYNTVLSDADIPKIRADTRKLREIAADYGVNYATIFYIQKRKTWRHVP